MINIGTNFKYQGKRFLDERQSIPTQLSDLLSWSTPIPEGFEVCVDNVWYVYDSSLEADPETGYFRKRLDYEFPGSIIEENIETIERELNPLKFLSFTSNEGTFEVGEIVNVSISWTINKESPFNIKINGFSIPQSSVSYSETIDDNTNREDKSFTVSITKDNETIEKTVIYSFRYKKFWGTSSQETIDENDIENFENDYCESWKMDTKIFDCTGGKYAYYVIPEEEEENLNSMYVGGMKVSDYSKSDITLSINNISKSYKIIKKDTLGTSKLNIKFDD